MANETDSTPTEPIPDSSARLRRAKEIYLQVNDLGLARREEVIDRLCAGDEALRATGDAAGAKARVDEAVAMVKSDAGTHGSGEARFRCEART